MLLEVVKTVLQIAPEIQKTWLISKIFLQLLHVLIAQSRRKDMDRDSGLSCRPGFDSDQVDLFDPIVGDGHTADGHTVAVDEDVSSETAFPPPDSV